MTMTHTGIQSLDFDVPVVMVSLPYGPIEKCRLALPANRVLKRFMDVFLGGILALLILPWLVPIVAVMIKLDSPGPVFFTQKRTGRHRKTFYCIKFRTMVVNPDADKLQVQPNDKRITKTGSFLRKFYVDEIPQLINVLWGNMSLVGPRPHMLRHNIVYARIIKNYHDRHKVKPGLSGLAQYRGYHGMISTKEDLVNRISSDIEYIENWNIWSDLYMFLATSKHILKSLGGKE
jgi:lipopolysaccharide/colanic/teichoic acid biosynthesis glycosyltransferase